MMQARALAMLSSSEPGPRRRPAAPLRLLQPSMWWAVYGLVATVPSLAYVLGLNEGFVGNLLYDLVGLSAAAAIVVGVRVHRPLQPGAWYALAAGQLLFVAGDVVWSYYQLVRHVAIPFPSSADVLYLAGYPALVGGVLVFARERSAGRDRARLVDTAIVTTSIGAYAWIFLIEPYATDPSLSSLERLISIAYPLGDLALVAASARLIVSVGRRSLAYGMLVAAFLLLLVADTIYGIQSLFFSYEPGPFTDGFWLAAYVLCGAAGLHASMRALTQPDVAVREGRRGVPLLLLTAGLLLMPGVLVIQEMLGRRVDTSVVVAGSVVLALLILARMTGLVRDVEGKVAELERRDDALRGALEDREALAEQLRHQAFHDPLTGAANRVLFQDRIEHALARRARVHEPVSVLFLDLDEFKSVNDVLGHAAGDRLLIDVAARLADSLRPSDTLARVGGDEFTVLLEGTGEVQARAVADRISEALQRPFDFDGVPVAVRASIGVAIDSQGRDDGAELLHKADLAMYEAKRTGKNRYHVFEPKLHQALHERRALQADLESALVDGTLTAHFQPLVDLHTEAIVGAEALVRWPHPGRGWIAPSEFVPLAEETDLIEEVDRAVMRLSLHRLAEWRGASPDFKLSVNLSARHLRRVSLAEEVATLLREEDVPGEGLVLEITETALLGHSDSMLEQLHSLRALGVRLALDDFGTGFSSLAHLRHLPIDILKIDKTFVDDLDSGERETSLAHVVHSLGARLRLVTIAEGVERKKQVDQLRALGCRLAQGYLFGRPQPADAFAMRLSNEHVSGGPLLGARGDIRLS